MARPIFSQSTAFYQADQGFEFDGSGVDVILERVGLTVAGKDQEGKPRSDPSLIKLLTELWPVFRGVSGTQIDISVGSQNRAEDSVTWYGPFPFILGQDYSIQPIVDFVYLSLRFVSSGQTGWSLLSYDLEIEILGVVP